MENPLKNSELTPKELFMQDLFESEPCQCLIDVDCTCHD
jgi:hypothetical protein